MGRRARTNCSPVDSVMEKYYNEIGNRLSGVFLPTHPTTESGEPLATEFSMLTLDTRHMNKSKAAPAKLTAQNKNRTVEDKCHESSESTTESDSSSSKMSTLSSTPSEQEPSRKRLVDKLTRGLFQRKHMCARCKRRSKSCLPNKTFSGAEKHYTCGRCREISYAVKNLFSGQSNSKDSGISESITQQSSEHVKPQPRTHLKDSGYETVTSCSTVASAYSAFNSPYNNSKRSDAISNSGAAPVKEGGELSLTNTNAINTTALTDSYVEFDPSSHAQCVCSDHEGASEDTVQLYQFLGVGQPGSSVGVLRQVKNRNVKNYDGYLPDVERKKCPKCHTRPALTDATNFEGHTENGDFAKPAKNATTTAAATTPSSSSPKPCFVCCAANKPSFRLPWKDGWLCEDCLDIMY